jgi:hypothetical protein
MSIHSHPVPEILGLHPCLAFFDALDKGAEARFNIECYSDIPKGAPKPQPDPLMARFADLTIDHVAGLIPELIGLNERGAGIFTTVNRCIGHRSINSVSKVRAAHADVDAATDQQRRMLLESLPPSIIVTSSELTKLHLYWLLNNDAAKEKDAVGQLNKLLAKDYGADKAATDVARILRVPGFRHMKYRHIGQTPVVTAAYNDRLYSLAEIQAAFPPSQISLVARANQQGINQDFSEVETEVIAEMKLRCPELWNGAWEQA